VTDGVRAWFDRLSEGSFRGVPFNTPQSERTGGRRGVTHEYPGQDDHTTQDLGRMAVRFTVTAIVIGANYDANRDDLINALEKGGPGKLVHRYFGTMDAEIEPGQTYRVIETQDQGGMATFTIPFIRASKPKFPAAVTFPRDRVPTKVNDSLLKSIAKAVNSIDTSGIESIRSDLLRSINQSTAILNEINSQISGAIATPNQVAGAIASLGNAAATIVATPSRIGELIDGLNAINEAIFESLRKVGAALFAQSIERDGTGQAAAQAQTDARKIVRVMRSALTKSQDLGTPANDNEEALFAFIKQSAAAHAANAAVEMPYDSQANALATRDQFDDVLEAIAAAGDDEIYATYTDLRVELSNHLTVTSGDLPRIVSYTPARSLPALLIAHRLYGDATRCEEIIARNNIRHPCFVSGGYPIQVISNA
jgi:prophage DNA circulation protein